MNAPLIERKFARAYLGDPESREAVELRRQIAKGAREALEEQYWDVIERTLQARPTEARLGGDPSVSNKIRAYVLVRHYRNGEWEDRIEVGARRGAYGPVMLTPLAACGGTTTLGKAILPCSDWTRPGGIGRGYAVSTGH